MKDFLRLSPSSINSQPWRFILASRYEAKACIAKTTAGFYVFNERKVLDASHVGVFCAKTSIDETDLSALLDKENADGRFASQQAMEGNSRGVRTL